MSPETYSSLMILCYQRTSFHWWFCVTSDPVFADDSVSPATQFSLMIYVSPATQFLPTTSCDSSDLVSLTNPISEMTWLLWRFQWWSSLNHYETQERPRLAMLKTKKIILMWWCSLYDCIMCETLKCEHVNSWDMYDDTYMVVWYDYADYDHVICKVVQPE
jgi:hypothetical protein